jgi:hypothetical protein
MTDQITPQTADADTGHANSVAEGAVAVAEVTTNTPTVAAATANLASPVSTVERAIFSIEGQVVEVPLKIAQDDDKVRAYLERSAPGIRTATIKRSVKNGVMTIEMIKHSGYMGAAIDDIVDTLRRADYGLNPVVALALELRDAPEEADVDVLSMQPRIEQALAEASELDSQITKCVGHLNAARPALTRFVPTGL